MFARIGRFTAHYRWPIIIAWVVALVVITLITPNLDDVASSSSADFLPAGAPFTEGAARLETYFPELNIASNGVVVLETTDGSSIRDDANWAYIAELTAWLEGQISETGVTSVISPTQDVPLMGDSLIAPDEQLALITVDFALGPIDTETIEISGALQEHIAATMPDNLNSGFTGSAPIFANYSTSAVESVDRTLGVTLLLVVLMLLLVYRSPVSPLVPLFSVGVTYIISRGIVAWIGANFLTITTYANVMLVVVLFGAGTDYCLFLISRFREEMADDDDARAATARTLTHVGETITSSAGTVIVGFAAMTFAEMGLFSATGPALVIGIVVMLLAGLTLTPALLSLLGHWAFWPGQASHRSVGALYQRVSALVSERAVLTIVVIAAVLAPFALYATGQEITYNMFADLPADDTARRGFELMEAHMGSGQVQPLSVVIDGLAPDTALAEIDRWAEHLLAVDGVADVRSLTNPLGADHALLTGITRIDRQLALAAELLAEVQNADPQTTAAALTPETVQLAVGLLPFAQEYLDAIEAQVPAMADDADFAAVRDTLTTLPAAALGGNLDAALATLQTHLAALSETLAGADAYYLPDALPESVTAAVGDAFGGEDPLQALTSRYVTADRDAAHFELILAINPYSDEATDIVRELRETLPGGAAAVSGFPTITTDLRDTIDRDMLRSFSFVLLGVLIVLIVLLRGLVAPLYLMLTILLSYAATIGITRLLSQLLFGAEALTWWVPYLMFVMLVALGMDYNIFLMGRVKEEVARHGIRDGVHEAVSATGAIITSAGLIMAGTFGAMMAGLVTGLRQLGLAVAIGVLLDTFVIRTALVPAITVLLGKWAWWPGRVPQATPDTEKAAPTAPKSEVPVSGK